MENLSIGYDHPLCTIDHLEIRRGDRLAILGPNGTGKSTFVKTLMNLIPSLGGSYLFGHQIEAGYFDQQLAQFSSGKTVLEELWDAAPDLDRTQVRSILGQFLFTADEVFKSVDVLSGGEKVRLMLSRMMLFGSNVLAIDQPTNHLDLESITAVNNGVRDFKGTVLFASHDHEFVQTIATRIIEIREKGVLDKECSYDEFLEFRETYKG